MASDAIVRDEGGRVTIELPAGSTHAALALRVQAETDEQARDILIGLADRFAAVVLEFNDAMEQSAAFGAGSVRIVHGAEAIAAFDVAAMQTAAAVGLERPGNHTALPDTTSLADHLRLHFAKRMGLDPNALLPWEQLKESEQGTWIGHANACIGFMAGAA